MGQYYKVFTKEGNGKIVVYNRKVIVDGKEEYTPAKLTEHSWFLNDFVNAICEKIYLSDRPFKLIWMGDYAKDITDFNKASRKTFLRYHDKCWKHDEKGVAINASGFTLYNLFIVNHTKKEYFDCTQYFNRSVMKSKYGDWCLHPIPLLTCVGNGLGCGDYTHPTEDSTFDLVGTWALDEISITDNPIAEYEEIYPLFKELGWN